MKVLPFDTSHIDLLVNHGGQEHLVSAISIEQVAEIVKHGNHYSFFSGDDLVACAGVVEIHEMRAVAWALLQMGKPEKFAALHIAVRGVLWSQPYERIEAFTDPSQRGTGRWMMALGFKLETPFKPFWFADGRGAAEWVRYNRG